MNANGRTLATSFLVAISLLTGLASAQGKKVEPGPIPNQIVAAKRVFIANAGGDERWHDDPLYTGGADRSYNQFYAAMKGAGKYELVGTPSDADLIFEIEFLVPTAEPPATGRLDLAAVPFDPQFRLTIRDPKTNVLLWGFTEHLQWAILRSNRDKNFDEAMTRILADVQGLAARAQVDASGGRSQ